jgi:hypothetical protein
MANELTELEFSLDDVVGGQPLTPETVNLPTLWGFLKDVETLIKGDVPSASLAWWQRCQTDYSRQAFR